MSAKTRQLNLRIDINSDELLNYMAERRKIPKAILAREMFINWLKDDALDFLLNDYQTGKIGLTQLIKLSQLPPRTILLKIAEKEIEPSISDAADNYTDNWVEIINTKLKKGEISWKKTPHKKINKDITPLSDQELNELD